MPLPTYDSLAKAIDDLAGEKYFLKTNSIQNRGCLEAEEEGLNAIAATGTIGTVRLFGKGVDPQKGIAFLLMERIEPSMPKADTWRVMGHEFAALHNADAAQFVQGGRYGFVHDNYIGASRQINTPKDKWVDFFRECRLEPQIKMAEHAFSPSVLKQVISLLDRLDDYLSEPAAPSLLHGDMWGGNHLVKKDGKVILIDPAAYVGHAEADLAMTQMFQPMHRDFYEGYFEINPRMDGYEDRREIYNLYHMLNHYNLFGGSYLTSAYHTIAYYA